MSDVLTVVVPIPGGKYPTINHLGANGFRGGKKTPEYRALKLAVRQAAHREMKRVGWLEPATWYVALEIIRLVPNRRRRDPLNMGKAECDSLEPPKPGDDRDPVTGYDPNDEREPFPGLYINDDLAIAVPRIELDLDGVDRVVIIARRCYPPLHAYPGVATVVDTHTAPKTKRATPKADPKAAVAAPGIPLTGDPTGAIPRGYGIEVATGILVPIAQLIVSQRRPKSQAVGNRRSTTRDHT